VPVTIERAVVPFDRDLVVGLKELLPASAAIGVALGIIGTA
jgi:hypothetical protein